MITLSERKIYINGSPTLILSGEIHYFRLPRERWQTAVDLLREAGGNCVASYIPWLCHEYEEGCFDFGETPSLDVFAFIDMCRDSGMYFIARPGPFVMAELKNEGIPYWVFDKDGDILPVTWDGERSPCVTCDYLNPAFLNAVDSWYGRVIPPLAERTLAKGGNVICVQLDNEIGMLPWVCNAPELTKTVIFAFCDFLYKKYPDPSSLYGFALEKDEKTLELFRSPKEEFSLRFHCDFAEYMRERALRYVEALKAMCCKHGLSGDTPLAVNIHGSGEDRATGYPIGLSQLERAFTAKGNVFGASDMYIGEMTIANFQDLVAANIFYTAVSGSPLASMEFECGHGDYGDDMGRRISPFATVNKTLLFNACGNKLLNYYLFSGGVNYRLPDRRHDGNDRIALTGERHGFAAPVTPETTKNISYDAAKRAFSLLATNSRYLADMLPVYDRAAIGYSPRSYATEYCYPKSACAKERAGALTESRDGFLSSPVRGLMLNGLNPYAVNLAAAPFDCEFLIAPLCRYMSERAQGNIAAHIKSGRGALLYGELPVYNMYGEDCRALADCLGIGFEPQSRLLRFESVVPEGFAGMSAESRARVFDLLDESGEVFLRDYDTSKPCGTVLRPYDAPVFVISASYRCDAAFYKRVLELAGVEPFVRCESDIEGVYASLMRSDEGGYVTLINLDGYPKTLDLFVEGERFLRGLELSPYEGLLLPHKLTELSLSANAELVGVYGDRLELRAAQRETVITAASELAFSKTVSRAEGGYILKTEKNEIISIIL